MCTEDNFEFWTMTPSGNLTKSGLLYEGNYTEWYERVKAIFEVHNGSYLLHDTAYVHRDRGKTTPYAKLITAQVGPTLLLRLANTRKRFDDPECFDHPAKILSDLRTLAKPFRFNDLPPELRNRVYGLHFQQSQEVLFCIPNTRNGIIPHSKERDTTLRNLLLVSRLVKEEAVPVMWSCRKFCYEWWRGGPNMTGAESTLKQWALKDLGENVRHVRHLRVRVPRSKEKAYVLITLDLKRGLATETPSWFTKNRRTAWKTHIAEVEEERKTLSLKGEALILAFLRKPGLWATMG